MFARWLNILGLNLNINPKARTKLNLNPESDSDPILLELRSISPGSLHTQIPSRDSRHS